MKGKLGYLAINILEQQPIGPTVTEGDYFAGADPGYVEKIITPVFDSGVSPILQTVTQINATDVPVAAIPDTIQTAIPITTPVYGEVVEESANNGLLWLLLLGVAFFALKKRKK